jgi:hypothetical protein
MGCIRLARLRTDRWWSWPDVHALNDCISHRGHHLRVRATAAEHDAENTLLLAVENRVGHGRRRTFAETILGSSNHSSSPTPIYLHHCASSEELRLRLWSWPVPTGAKRHQNAVSREPPEIPPKTSTTSWRRATELMQREIREGAERSGIVKAERPQLGPQRFWMIERHRKAVTVKCASRPRSWSRLC